MEYTMKFVKKKMQKCLKLKKTAKGENNEKSQ